MRGRRRALSPLTDAAPSLLLPIFSTFLLQHLFPLLVTAGVGDEVDLAARVSAMDRATREHTWTPIERRDAAGLSYEEFRDVYKRTKTPVIITNHTQGWEVLKWDFDRIQRECTGDHVHFVDKGLFLIQMLPDAAKRQWEAELRRVFGKDFSELINDCRTGMSVPDFVDYVRRQRSDQEVLLQDFSHLVHYFLPLHMHSFPLHKFCSRKLVQDVVVPKYLLGKRIEEWCVNHAEKGPVYGGIYDPEIFFAANHSRAYPAHLHGISADILLLVVRGKKKYVGWPYEQREKLYRFELGSQLDQHTETQDEIFLAEGIRPNLEVQPDLKGSEGWEGFVEEGELLYIPCGHVHQVENLEPTFSLTFRALDEDVVSCSRELKDMGAHTMEMSFLDEIEERCINDPSAASKDLRFADLRKLWCPHLKPWSELAADGMEN